MYRSAVLCNGLLWTLEPGLMLPLSTRVDERRRSSATKALAQQGPSCFSSRVPWCRLPSPRIAGFVAYPRLVRVWFTEAVSVKCEINPVRSHIRSTSSSAHKHGLDVAKCTRIAVSLSFAQTRGQEEEDQPKLLGEALLPVQGRDEGGTG